jgi:hypothetical protein
MTKVSAAGKDYLAPLTPARQQLAQIAEILAAGLMRALAKKSSQMSPAGGESSLDISAAESGHPSPYRSENSEWLTPSSRNWQR